MLSVVLIEAAQKVPDQVTSSSTSAKPEALNKKIEAVKRKIEALKRDNRLGQIQAISLGRVPLQLQHQHHRQLNLRLRLCHRERYHRRH